MPIDHQQQLPSRFKYLRPNRAGTHPHRFENKMTMCTVIAGSNG